MWEVFHRREAWHWLKSQEASATAIAYQAGCRDMRPKCPTEHGLTEHCALMIRRLLHSDPSKRPSAKDVTGWLQRQIRALARYIIDEKSFQASESEAQGMLTNKRKVLDRQKRYALSRSTERHHFPARAVVRSSVRSWCILRTKFPLLLRVLVDTVYAGPAGLLLTRRSGTARVRLLLSVSHSSASPGTGSGAVILSIRNCTTQWMKLTMCA